MGTLRFLAFFFFFFFTLISLSSEILAATDTLSLNQSLSDGQTLVSSDQTFELGFFSPGKSKNRYMGIWFKNITVVTVVWVANRANPVTDSTGVLTIASDGNLVISNGSKSVLWTSNLTSKAENPIAQLLPTGNFVVREGNTSLWQSFEHLVDTVLVNVNITRHKDLIAWKSADDPSPGDFSFGMVTRGLTQMVIRKGSVKQFRSGPWNGLQFGGLSYFWYNPVFKPSLPSDSEEGKSVFKRIFLTPSGSIQRLTWNDQLREWSVLLSVPQDDCDKYGYCGANSICDVSKETICECLLGFRPKSQQDWEKGNWSDGCVRRTKLENGERDGFLAIQKLKLPDALDYWNTNAMSLDECKRGCLRNSSCSAYANSDYSEGGRGCILWFGELMDITQLSDEGLQDMYLKLAMSDIEAINNSHKKGKPVVLIIILSVCLLMAILGLIGWYIIRNMKRKGGDSFVYGDESTEDDPELPLFDWITIANATDNFSSANKIGEGGFGPVYKGRLVEGQEIAVKRLSKDSGQGLTEFKTEVSLIAKLQHRNLVKLLGCCIQSEEKMLIYEYMANESLDYFIFDKDRANLLVWQKRFDIILGIARGLLYLHQDSRLRIIHRDLKTSNILLDEELNPKISDFGMARIFGEDQIEVKTKRVVGTYGYMSPEYALDGCFSTKSDVFSFGVVVLEIVSGKKNRGFSNSEDDNNLLGNAWMLWKEGKPMQIMDAGLEDSCFPSEVLKCIQVGLLCVQQLARDRPTMASVVSMLGSETVSLPQPTLPGYFTESSIDIIREESRSENDVTITLLGGR